MRMLFGFAAFFTNYFILESTFAARVSFGKPLENFTRRALRTCESELEFVDVFDTFSLLRDSRYAASSPPANWNKNSCLFPLLFLYTKPGGRLFQLRPEHRDTPGETT